jgi:hypothetical protein
MTNDSEIRWVTLTLEFPDEIGARLQKVADEAGISLQCYCVRVLFRELLKEAPAAQKELCLRQLPATLRKNGCDDSADL